jgi:catechol 2,3-dioxygenase-like lactoylglutathione lyase family enzyme
LITSCQSFAPALGNKGTASSLDMYVSTTTPFHHTAIRTRDIEVAINFYSLLDFEVETKFLAGNVRAAWLQQKNQGVRIELIEVPSSMLNEPEGARRRAVDLMQRSDLLGLNHYAIDVTSSMKSKGMKRLQEWIDQINVKSEKKFGKSLRIAVEPQEQMIGQHLYQLAFIYDADGTIVELLYQQRRFKQEMISGWYV